jgi:predicted MFS family arabinose efflux permease
VLLFAFSKPVWAFTFGASGLFTAYSFSIYGMGDLGTSLLYGSRGFGAFIGPLLVNAIVTPKTMRDFSKVVLASNVIFITGYFVFGLSTSVGFGAIGIVIGHIGGSSVWGLSRLYVQRETDDYVRGRVLAIDQMLFQLSTALVTLMMGLLTTAFALQHIVLGGIGVTILLTLLWAWRASTLAPLAKSA